MKGRGGEGGGGIGEGGRREGRLFGKVIDPIFTLSLNVALPLCMLRWPYSTVFLSIACCMAHWRSKVTLKYGNWRSINMLAEGTTSVNVPHL